MELPELNDEQKKLLTWIERAGAISPSQLLAQTQFQPREAWDMMQLLVEHGFLIMREDPDSPDGSLILPVTLTK